MHEGTCNYHVSVPGDQYFGDYVGSKYRNPRRMEGGGEDQEKQKGCLTTLLATPTQMRMNNRRIAKLGHQQLVVRPIGRTDSTSDED